MTYFDVNLDLTKEDKAIREEAHRFAKEVMRPISIELDKMTAEQTIAADSPLWGFMRQAYGLGFHKAAFPEAVGGLGTSPFQSHIFLEELLWGSVGLAACVVLAGWPYLKILATGNPELIEEFVIPFCRCDDGTMSGCWAVTEPDHGTDSLAVGEKVFHDLKIKGQCVAVLDGNAYVITGQKSAWVSCAPTASHCMLNVQIDMDKGLAGGGVCILPLNLPGVSRGKPLEKVGQRDLPQGELFFDEVRIPKRWMFYGPDQYGESILGNLGFGNTAVSVVALALARAAFDEALKYVRQRVQGGKPLIDQYAMKIRIHRMFAAIEAMRAMSRAIWNLNLRTNPPICEYALAAKTFCSETAREVIDEGVQIHGANGLTKEYLIEKLWRDSRALTIEDGDNTALNRLGGHILKDTYPRKRVNVVG
jgi:acyl-CoA dehydrogenase